MKTLHLTNAWHETSGGIATFYKALVEQANRREHEIRLVVPDTNDRIEDVGKFGRIYFIKAPTSLLNSSYRTIYPPQFLFSGSKLQRILIAERPDLVEICDKYALNYLGAILRLKMLPGVDFRPVVMGLSCERMDDNFRTYVGSFPFNRQFCSVYMRWLYFPFFDHHIANSEYTAAELRTVAQGHLVPRGTWIRGMGVDFKHLSPKRKSQLIRERLLKRFEANESTLLLYVGRLVPEKNLKLLFELLTFLTNKSNHDFRLLIVGDGVERQHWETKYKQELPGRAAFLGHIKDHAELADIYANCDVFVHPNPREPFGIAPLEAMASGLPLIAPNRGGVTSYANLDNAWTVEGDAVSFAAAVEEVIANEELRGLKIANGLLTAEQYRWETATSSFLDLYAEIFEATKMGCNNTLAPAFWSTKASGFQAASLHGVSQAAQKIFGTGIRLLKRKSARHLISTSSNQLNP